MGVFGALSTALSTASAGASTVSVQPVSVPSDEGDAFVRADSRFHSGSLLHLERMTEAEISRRLLQRASFWNFRRLSLTRPEDLKDDPFEQLAYAAALGDIFAAAGSETTAIVKALRRMGCDREAIEFARSYVPQRSKIILETLDIRTRDERRRLACEFLDFALHARQEIGVCLFLARKLALTSGLDWAGLLRERQERRSAYERELASFVREEGDVVPFDRYYERAMFDPIIGTYTSKTAEHLIATGPSPSPESFFRTASVEPSLAKSLFLYAQNLWARLGRPETFRIVEMGAGMGSLAEAVLSLIENLPVRDPFRAAVTYTIVEKSPALARIQENRLGRFNARVEILRRSAVVGSLPVVRSGLFFSNELVDMFPPRKIVNAGGRLYEGYLAYRGGLLQEVKGTVREETAAFLNDRGICLKPGETYYIQPDIDPWIRALDAALERGEVVTIDYGERRGALRLRRHEFGRSMFRGYFPGTDPKWALAALSIASYRDSPTGVARPKDMTVDVDFTTLEEAAAATSLKHSTFSSQNDWTRQFSGEEPEPSKFSGFRVSILSKGL